VQDREKKLGQDSKKVTKALYFSFPLIWSEAPIGTSQHLHRR